MKKLALLVGLLLLAGCPKHEQAEDAGPPAGPPKVAEAEPNDDAAHAQKLTGAADVTAALTAPAGKKADEDWFEIQVPAGQRAVLSVDPAPPLDLALELFDGDGVKRYAQDGAAGGGSEVLRALGSGRVNRLRIFSKKGEPGAYHLVVGLEPDDGTAELEPNNRAADATPLTADKPLKGYLADALDEDWFHLALPGPEDAGAQDSGASAPTPPALPEDSGAPAAAAGALDAGAVVDGGPASDGGPSPDAGAAAVTANPALPPPPPPTLLHLTVGGVPGVRLDVSVVNAAQATVFSARGKAPGDPVEVRNLALRAPERDFYVVVRSAPVGTGKDARRGAAVDQPYTISAQLEVAKGAVELEPNDDAAHATPLDATGSIEGYLTPRSDVDEYLVHADTPVIARAELSGVEHLDLELSVVSAPDGGKEQTLLSANDGEIKEPEVLTNLAFGPGDLHLQVRGAARKGPDGKWSRESENAKDPYRLTVTTAPDDGTREREPNNAPEYATPIQLGQTLRGNIQPRRDVDFYRLDLSQQPVKVNLKATVTGILKVDVALYLYRLKPDGSLGLVQTSDTGKADAPETITYAVDPGVYLLKVKDTRDRESNFVDSYALHVEAP